MKIVFLDIDGVVNCKNTTERHRGYIGIDPYMAFLVGKIQLDTDCQFVLSSSWRHIYDGVSEVEKQVAKMFGKTGRSKDGLRGTEVYDWMVRHQDNLDIERYAILDDGDDFSDNQPLFRTSWNTGITPEIAQKVTDYLNGKIEYEPAFARGVFGDTDTPLGGDG